MIMYMKWSLLDRGTNTLKVFQKRGNKLKRAGLIPPLHEKCRINLKVSSPEALLGRKSGVGIIGAVHSGHL